MTAQEWTTTPPESPGWYWCKPDSGRPITVVMVHDGLGVGAVLYKGMWNDWSVYASQLPPGRWLRIEEPKE